MGFFCRYTKAYELKLKPNLNFIKITLRLHDCKETRLKYS
jgi:hypothetical protein